MNKLHIKYGKFYLKAIASGYFDYNALKSDLQFLKILMKLEKSNTLLEKYILEEKIIGENFKLKYYINYINE